MGHQFFPDSLRTGMYQDLDRKRLFFFKSMNLLPVLLHASEYGIDANFFPMSDRPARFFKILIVDAQFPRRQELADVLIREGYQVRAVGDGETAWVMAQEHLPDLVIGWLTIPGL